jgi:hypothetical protein
MTGLATRILVAQKVLSALEVEDAALYATLNDPLYQKWYMFGALGPAIGDFVPSTSAGLGAPPISPYFLIWQHVLSIAVGNSTATPPIPGLASTLQTLTAAVDKLSSLVAAHDFSGMEAFSHSGQLDAINQASADLTTILTFFTQPANLVPITNLICSSNPKINSATQLVPQSFWAGRDWLHWKHTGDFAEALYTAAKAQNDDRYLAYAVGWQVAFATLVCSSGFMNSVVGTSYRTYWWRHRWMDLVVDAWAWGYYGADATMREDNPNPPYDQWKPLCAAGLQNLIDLTNGADPPTIAQAMVAGQPVPDIADLDAFATNFWLPAWMTANENPASPVFTTQGLLTGYYMLWLVLWFQTSGAVVGCNPAPPATPPSTCGSNPTPPDWIDPTKTNPATGQPFLPQEPTPKHDPNTGEVICGAILGILGLASEFFGGGIVGAGAIAGGVALIVDGEQQLNWDELDCQLYWLKVYLYGGLEALHKLTVLAGFQHPYPADLGTSQGPLTFSIADLEYPVFGDLCLSMPVQSMLTPWNCNLIVASPPPSTSSALDWTQRPSWGAEAPPTLVWAWRLWWPDSFIDNKQGSNHGGADITVAPATFDTGVESPFPASVGVAVGLITAPPAALPNWNLDGDRGLGWLTWELAAPYAVPVAPVAST